MNWQIYVTATAQKQIKKLPQHYSEMIKGAINGMGSDPFAGDLEKIGGEKNIWRRRVGSYRILYEIYSDTKFIHIFNIERRTSSTYR